MNKDDIYIYIYIYIYMSEILFSHDKEGNVAIVTIWMDLEGIGLSEISQTEKDKYCMLSPICGI